MYKDKVETQMPERLRKTEAINTGAAGKLVMDAVAKNGMMKI